MRSEENSIKEPGVGVVISRSSTEQFHFNVTIVPNSNSDENPLMGSTPRNRKDHVLFCVDIFIKIVLTIFFKLSFLLVLVQHF